MFENGKQSTKYDDIIHLSHHVSTVHPPMAIRDRAAQFSPFAALTGHEAAIKETARLTERRIELDENRKSMINETLQCIAEEIAVCPFVKIEYFVPDDKKEGGTYVTVEGCVKKIDVYSRWIRIDDGTVIALDEIYDITYEKMNRF